MIEISIIIPTYNEKDNVLLLLERVHTSMKNFNYEIVIIDDNSPDGTSELVDELSRKYPVKLTVRKNEKGLASAVVEGFKNAGGNIFVVMDADLQHPPEKTTSLVEEIYKGSDIVVGSRYIEREGFEEFGFIRKAISRCANIPARILFRELGKVRDIQSGFFALKREVVENLDLNPRGYKILIEILVLGNYRNVKEISYDFSKRKHGKTKLGIGTIVDYVFHLATLSWRKGGLKRFTKFCFVGIIGIFVNTAILFLFTNIGIFYILSSLLAHEISIITNFVMNDRWAFREFAAESRHSFLMRAMHYNWTRVLGVMISIFLLYFFTEFLSINYLISNVMAIMLGVVYGYSTAIMIVWRN